MIITKKKEVIVTSINKHKQIGAGEETLELPGSVDPGANLSTIFIFEEVES